MTDDSIANYRPCVVTFLDILGFANLVAKESANEIAQLVSSVQRSAADTLQAEGETKYNWTRTFAFSDSVVRIRPYDSA